MDMYRTMTEINDTKDQGDIIRDGKIKQLDGQQEAKEGNIEDPDKFSVQEHEASVADDDQVTREIWIPPEPENSEDESEDNIANYDEYDEESGVSFAWGKSNSSSDDRDKQNRSPKLEEEKQRMMEEIKNRKFKKFVCQIIESAGVTSSAVYDESWIDIVTDLSWEAASSLKAAVIDGNPVQDANAYVKVKCIATGSRSQSEVIKGLVFKKHAAHKHMRTEYKNPRILLLEDALSQSKGLASFKSIEDNDYVKRAVDRIETCNPDIILVEKSVSRDVQEYIFRHGVTLVSDMKLHRLKRIAHCIGSQILSPDTLTGQNIKHCGSFHIEKFVEEHNAVEEGGKKLGKTLMFLERCQTLLGCTILLKGSHSDELKRIKEVVQYAVVMAYHLMLETSFLIDLQTMFSTIPFVRAAVIVPADKKPPELETGVSEVSDDSDTKFEGSCEKDVVVDEAQCKNLIVDSQSILVLTSVRNAHKGTICEQSHFSHIMFCKHSDVSLGKFLGQLFNHCTDLNISEKRSLCNICTESPQAHLYDFTHQNKQLTIQINKQPERHFLPGWRQGKLWMWSRCGRCKTRKEISASTKRVLLSNSARNLSFGKFLELSLSGYCLANRLSGCGHSLDLDFLHFFGQGSMVAIFRYSQVTTYIVSLPPQKLEFKNSIKTGWLEKEFEKVFTKGISLFEEVASFLKRSRFQFTGSGAILQVSVEEWSDVEEMLKKECLEFEANVKKAFEKTKNGGNVFHKLLSPNRMRWELLLEACIWYRRLDALLCETKVTAQQAQKARSAVDPRTNFSYGDKAYFAKGSLNFDSPVEASEITVKDIQTICPVQDEQEDDHQSANGQEAGESFSNAMEPENNSAVMTEGSCRLDPTRSSDWFWLSFSEIQSRQTAEIESLYLSKIESVNRLTQENLPTVHQIISEEGSRLHFSLGDDHCLVSDFEGELSSLVACALARLGDHPIGFLKTKHLSPDGFLDHGSALLETLNPEVSFGPVKPFGKSKYTVRCLYVDEFRGLRELYGLSEFAYIASLNRCKQWDATVGKCESVFAKTIDDRFIIKEIKKKEYDSFVKFAPDYFKYMKDSYDSHSETCLAKLLGIYQVVIRQAKNGKEIRYDLMVMENLTFNRTISRLYDLKGAPHARYTSTADGGAGGVLLDQNFVIDMEGSAAPLYLSRTSKRSLERAVWNDTNFLNRMNMMDYSLLVGVDAKTRELVCGIINYFREYTWDKQLETWVKSSLGLGVPKNVLPIVISPENYKKRLRKFISTNFLSVPDHWCKLSAAKARYCT